MMEGWRAWEVPQTRRPTTLQLSFFTPWLDGFSPCAKTSRHRTLEKPGVPAYIPAL